MFVYLLRCSLRDSWEEGSFFVISTLDKIELLRGTCDFGGKQGFFFFRKCLMVRIESVAYTLIYPNQSWKYSDGPVSSDWMYPDFDDSRWSVKQYAFPLYSGSRYYRFSVTVDTSALETSGAAMFCIVSRDVSSLFLNGIPIFERLNTTLLSTNPSSNATFQNSANSNLFTSNSTLNSTFPFHLSNSSLPRSSQIQSSCFQYSIPVQWLQASLTIAVQSDSTVSEPIEDLFDLTCVLIPKMSSRMGETIVTSTHNRDYYSNPVDNAWDSNRVTFWKSIGCATDFVVTFPANR